MKKYLNLLFVAGVLLGLISCRENCSSFDMNNLSWTPYQEDDVIELYSQLNDSTIAFSIKSVVVMHTTHVSFGTKCGGCDDQIFINGYDDSDFYVEIYLFNGKSGSQNYHIVNSYFSDYTEVRNFIFDSKEYDIVRIFDNGGSNGKFKRLIIAKDIGVIGLVDIYDNTWTLKIGAKSKSPDKKGIVINNTSC